MAWDEPACARAIARICDDAATRPERMGAWRELLAAIGPEVEAWAMRSPILRHARLATPDDARAILVAVIERLAADDFANLRLFLARRGPPTGEADVVDSLRRLDEDDDARDTTPLRAWLITLQRYLERDHVRRRTGWAEADKRAVNTDAARLPTDGVAGERPPITDALALAAVVEELRAQIATFPAEMARALELWMHDEPFDDIARALALTDAARARALVRAGHARLRERFRDRLPAWFA